jgi:Zn-dependent protease with chaperone function
MELEQQTKFDLIVRQLERSARQNSPTNFQLRVAALAAIGYGYIWLVCLAIFGSLWLVRWLLESTQYRSIQIDPHLLWGLLYIVTISTFWVQYTPLKDRELRRSECPELFMLIDELRGSLNTPPIHHVVINYDHNAAVYQSPRLGFLGWYGWHRNYLLIGLPLMQSLSPEQFKSTLIHELGHLLSNDALFLGSLIRLSQMWERLTIDRNLFIFQWFFRWYEPLINAYSFVLVRDREYAADALSQKIVGQEITASDLIQTYIYQYHLQEFFKPQLDRQAHNLDTPPANVVTQMITALRQPLNPKSARIWLGLLLGEATDTDDTHPCLSDRLAAVGYPTPTVWTPQPLRVTAAEQFFGDRLTDLAAELDLRWQESHRTEWLHQHQQAQYQREYLAELNRLAKTEALTLNEATSQAELMTELQGELLALPFWQEILAQHPNHPQANYQVGKILINRGHWSGCVYLEQAIALDPDLVIPSCEELYRFYTFQGDLASAEIYLEWRQQHLPKQWRSKLERNIKATDQFVPHDLDPDLVTEIRRKLVNYPIVDRAYLVCKPMQIFTDRHLYILGLQLIHPHSTERQKLPVTSELERDLCDRLRIELNFGERLVIATFDRRKSKYTNLQDFQLIENIAQVPAANIF